MSFRAYLGHDLTVDAGYRYDDVREHQGFVGARLRIPLGGDLTTTQSEIAQFNGQERRMLDAINREDPVSQTHTSTKISGGTNGVARSC